MINGTAINDKLACLFEWMRDHLVVQLAAIVLHREQQRLIAPLRKDRRDA